MISIRFKYMVAFVFISYLPGNICNAQLKQVNIDIDTNHYSIDTSIHKLLINKKSFSIEFFRKKVINENKKEKELALLMRNANNNDVEYFKTFDENEYNISIIDNKLFLELIFNGGGSGFTGKLF